MIDVKDNLHMCHRNICLTAIASDSTHAQSISSRLQSMWSEMTDGERVTLNNFMTNLHDIRAPLNSDLKEKALCDYMFVDANIVDEEDLTVVTERTKMDTGALKTS